MTKISVIHDAFVSLVDTELGGYTQIPNPYSANDNAHLLMLKGFGVAVGAATNTERFVSCKETIEREFGIVLINRIETTANNIDVRETITKSLLEDHFTIVDAIEKDPSLNGGGSPGAFKTKYVADAGIEFVEVDRAKFFLIQSVYLAEYIEDII